MKQIVFPTLLLFTFLLVIQNASAQVVSDSTVGYSQQLNLVLTAPVGVFQRSHLAGAGLEYRYAKNRFGRDAWPGRKTGWLAAAGADYLLGKKVETAGYKFKYDGYFYFHLKGAVVHSFQQNLIVSLGAGPGLGLYEGEAKAGLFAELGVDYFQWERLSLGGGIQWRKQGKTDGLLSFGIKMGYCL